MPQTGGSVYKRDGVWFARLRFTDREGAAREKKRRAQPNTKGAAEDALDTLKAEVAVELGGRVVAGTFPEIREHFAALYARPPEIVGGRVVAGLRSWKTILSHLKYIDARFGRSLLSHVGPAELEAFRTELLRPVPGETADDPPRLLNVATVNRILATLRAIYSLAVRDKLVKESPFASVKGLIETKAERPRERVLSVDEELRLLDALSAPERLHLWLKAVIALETGMREGEINGLQRGDIDFGEGVVHARRTRTKTGAIQPTKTGEPRAVPLSRRLEEALVAAGVRELAADDFVMRSGLATKRAWSTACEKAKVTGLQFRDLRTTAGMRWLAKGVEFAVVAKILGHADTKTTYRWYTQLDAAALAQAKGVMDGKKSETNGPGRETKPEQKQPSLAEVETKGVN